VVAVDEDKVAAADEVKADAVRAVRAADAAGCVRAAEPASAARAVPDRDACVATDPA
jgi:hypothetical protein